MYASLGLNELIVSGCDYYSCPKFNSGFAILKKSSLRYKQVNYFNAFHYVNTGILETPHPGFMTKVIYHVRQTSGLSLSWPLLKVVSLKRIWGSELLCGSDTRSWILRVPDLQTSNRDLTYASVTSHSRAPYELFPSRAVLNTPGGTCTSLRRVRYAIGLIWYPNSHR